MTFLNALKRRRLTGGAMGIPEMAPPETGIAQAASGEPNTIDFGSLGRVGQDQPNEFDSVQQEQTPAFDAYQSHVNAIPMREAPTRGRRILAAALGGLGAIDNLGEGLKIGQEVLNEPYQRKISDWATKGKSLEMAAKLENASYAKKLNIAKAMSANSDRDRSYNQRAFGMTETNRRAEERNQAAGAHQVITEKQGQERINETVRHNKFMENKAPKPPKQPSSRVVNHEAISALIRDFPNYSQFIGPQGFPKAPKLTDPNADPNELAMLQKEFDNFQKQYSIYMDKYGKGMGANPKQQFVDPSFFDGYDDSSNDGSDEADPTMGWPD